jgi:hypothetical protein
VSIGGDEEDEPKFPPPLELDAESLVRRGVWKTEAGLHAAQVDLVVEDILADPDDSRRMPIIPVGIDALPIFQLVVNSVGVRYYIKPFTPELMLIDWFLAELEM